MNTKRTARTDAIVQNLSPAEYWFQCPILDEIDAIKDEQ